MSAAIKASTGLVLALNFGFFVAAMWIEEVLIGALLLAAICFFCYLYAPVAYELRGDRLIVGFRRGEPVNQPEDDLSRLPGE